MPDPQKRYQDEEGNWVDPNTVQGGFSQKSLSSKAFDPDRKRAANDEIYNAVAWEKANAAMEEERQNSQISYLQQRARAEEILQKNRATKAAKKGVRGVSSLARWSGIGIAFTAWTWQLILAAISLIGIGIWGSLDYILNENFIGKAVNTVAKWVGFDFQKLFPAEYLALGFWALATLVGLFTFIGFMLWFYLTGVRMFRSTASTLLAALVFASFMLPVSNLFPGILLWVIYVNAMETASMLTSLKKGAS